MKNYLIISAIFLSFLFAACNTTGNRKDDVQTKKDTVTATGDDIKWRLAVQAWSFHEFTFCEAVDKARKVGLKYLEAYPGQEIGGGFEGTTHYTMDEQAMTFIKDTLANAGLELVNYGVVKADSAHTWHHIFKFAKNMGIETLTAEPQPAHMDTVEALAMKYDIKTALHNHPDPSVYWHPDSVLAVIDGRCKHHIGACMDNGHWTRSGLDVMESMNKLEGRILALHLKDMNKKNEMKAHTVPFGQGVNDLKAILNKLKDQGFDGVITIEYEYNWEDNVEDIKASVDYFNEVTSSL